MNISSIVQVLAGLSWMIVLAAIVLAGLTVARGGKVGGMVPLVIGAVVLAVVLNVVGAGLVVIEPQEHGVVIAPLVAGGVRPDPLKPGLHWIIPFAERVEKYPISRQSYTMSSTTGEGQVIGDDSVKARTKDGQEIFIDASVIYAIDPLKVVALHITWQSRYEDAIVRPLARGIIRDMASQYGVEEIVSSKRVEMELLITDELTKKFAENNLTLVDFLVRNVAFSDQYSLAVEQKQIAEQQAQQAQLVVEQKRQEAEQARQVAQGQADAAVIAAKGAAESRLIQAEAEAKSLALIAAALRDNPDLIQYTYVQKLGGNVQVMLVPSNSPYLFNLPEVPVATAPVTSAPTTEPGTTTP